MSGSWFKGDSPCRAASEEEAEAAEGLALPSPDGPLPEGPQAGLPPARAPVAPGRCRPEEPLPACRTRLRRRALCISSAMRHVLRVPSNSVSGCKRAGRGERRVEVGERQVYRTTTVVPQIDTGLGQPG